MYVETQETTATTDEIEINFRFDENGRTIKTTTTTSTGGEDDKKDANEPSSSSLSPTSSSRDFYKTKTTMTDLASLLASTWSSATSPASSRSWYDDLLFDCQISDSCLMPRTFWVPYQRSSDWTGPRFTLEQFALDVFNHHVSKLVPDTWDPTTSGAEWWCQLRPSPAKTGRYAATAKVKNSDGAGPTADDANDDDDDDDDDDNEERNGISFHVDKDEDLRILAGGSTYVCPHLSTVTYLTSMGAPTTIFDNIRIHPLEGSWMVPDSKTATSPSNDQVNAFISWPRLGKHVSFDGRFLHGAPSNMMKENQQQREETATGYHMDLNDESEQQQNQQRKVENRRRRITFLVNVWLNYKPFNVNPFPESMVDKMSGYSSRSRDLNTTSTKYENGKGPNDDISVMRSLTFLDPSSLSSPVRFPTTHTVIAGRDTTKASMKTFIWPLGDRRSQEKLKVVVPDFNLVRKAATSESPTNVGLDGGGGGGDNVCIVYPHTRTIQTTTVLSCEDGHTATTDIKGDNGSDQQLCLYSPHICGPNSNDHDDTGDDVGLVDGGDEKSSKRQRIEE